MITAMIADCGVCVPRANPFALSPACSVRLFSHKCARLLPPCINLRMLVAAVATTLGGKLAVNT